MTDVPRLSCDEVAELTGGYALDALSPEERHAVEAHVDECQLHEEISQLRLAAASVALSVDEVAPPSGLRDRVLAIPDAGVVAFEAEPAASGLLEFIRRPAVAYGFAAALAAFALLVGLAIGNSTGGDGDTQVVAVSGSAGGGEHRLVYSADDDFAVLSIRGLPDLDVSFVYQVWLIRDAGAVEGVGLFSTQNGAADVALSLSLEAGDVIAVTVEPAGGSPQPTTEILISGAV